MSWADATGAVLALLGALGVVLGGCLHLLHRHFYRSLRSEPFHRDGDAVAAYVPGCSRILLTLGGLAALAGGLLIYYR